MARKPAVASPELLAKIYDLYSQHTGEEIAAAIAQYRSEHDAEIEQSRIRAEIARLNSQLVS